MDGMKKTVVMLNVSFALYNCTGSGHPPDPLRLDSTALFDSHSRNMLNPHIVSDCLVGKCHRFRIIDDTERIL
ncbi:hypothetical protein N7453_005667 [Penicillium expansum]|nr:hypothetical protein N7453_005667 [Penicillium expansum]